MAFESICPPAIIAIIPIASMSLPIMGHIILLIGDGPGAETSTSETTWRGPLRGSCSKRTGNNDL
jgi:hypothetical protein